MICEDGKCYLVLQCRECKVDPIVTDGFEGVLCLCPECGKQLYINRWNYENVD